MTIRWQDGTLSTNICSTELSPCTLSESELYPGTIIQKGGPDLQVGLVIAVDSRQRLAKVRWYDEEYENLVV